MDTFAVEHIIPRSKGSSNDLSNLAFSCLGCNGCKYTRTTAIDPETKQSAPLHNPRIEALNIHFAWCQDYTQIIGLTNISGVPGSKHWLILNASIRQRCTLKIGPSHQSTANFSPN